MMNSWGAAKVASEAGHPPVFISFTGAGVYGGGWTIVHLTKQTDPSRIHNGGKRIFHGRRTDAEGLQAAKDWTSERYGVTSWVKIPGLHGDWFPAEAEQVIKAALKEHRRKK